MLDYIYQAKVAHMWALYQSTLDYANEGYALGVGVDATLVNAIQQLSPRVMLWSQEGAAFVGNDDSPAVWVEKGARLAADIKSSLDDTPGKVALESAKNELIDTSKELRSVLSSNLLWLAIGAALVVGGYIYFTRGGTS